MLNKLRPTLFYPYTVSVNKCGGSWNTIDDRYAQVCVLTKVKHINVTVFNLMSVVNETRFLVQHQSCECKCRLNESVWTHEKEIKKWVFGSSGWTKHNTDVTTSGYLLSRKAW